MSSSDLCPRAGLSCPQPLASSCNEPCVRQCPDSSALVQPPPVVLTLPGPILSSFPQHSAVGSAGAPAFRGSLAFFPGYSSGVFPGYSSGVFPGYSSGVFRGHGARSGYGISPLGSCGPSASRRLSRLVRGSCGPC
ncbi:KRCL protein, partial [Anthoscopus minutus]|nr:KRCL protein [Anthoscopus minutus]